MGPQADLQAVNAIRGGNQIVVPVKRSITQLYDPQIGPDLWPNVEDFGKNLLTGAAWHGLRHQQRHRCG
jgi:hypothetical protein